MSPSKCSLVRFDYLGLSHRLPSVPERPPGPFVLLSSSDLEIRIEPKYISFSSLESISVRFRYEVRGSQAEEASFSMRCLVRLLNSDFEFRSKQEYMKFN